MWKLETREVGKIVSAITGNRHPHKKAASPKSGPAAILAEKEGFEPSCPFQGYPISSRARYDHFDTSPRHICHISPSEKGEN